MPKRHEEDVVVNDLLARLSLLLQLLQVADQVADGKVGRVALAVVAEFLACLEVSNFGGGNVHTLVAAAMEDSLDHLFVLPRETPEEDGHVIAFRPCKRALYWFFELAHAGCTISFTTTAMGDLLFLVPGSRLRRDVKGRRITFVQTFPGIHVRAA
jgi:hypothetical protein